MDQQDLIVVGVDGTPAGEGALRFAADEAARRGVAELAAESLAPEGAAAPAVVAGDPGQP